MHEIDLLGFRQYQGYSPVSQRSRFILVKTLIAEYWGFLPEYEWEILTSDFTHWYLEVHAPCNYKQEYKNCKIEVWEILNPNRQGLLDLMIQWEKDNAHRWRPGNWKPTDCRSKV